MHLQGYLKLWSSPRIEVFSFSRPLITRVFLVALEEHLGGRKDQAVEVPVGRGPTEVRQVILAKDVLQAQWTIMDHSKSTATAGVFFEPALGAQNEATASWVPCDKSKGSLRIVWARRRGAPAGGSDREGFCALGKELS